MSEQEEFVGRVRGLVISLWGILTAEECREVEHLVEHDEVGEALRALAWIIVEGDKKVPPETINAIYGLSRGLVDDADMPPTLRDHAAGRTPPASLPTPDDPVAAARATALELYELVSAEPDPEPWPRFLRGVLGELDAVDELGPTKAIASAREKYTSMLGGMGSFNDFWINRPDPRERDALNDKLKSLKARLRDLLTPGQPSS